jgi:hypothetical protein
LIKVEIASSAATGAKALERCNWLGVIREALAVVGIVYSLQSFMRQEMATPMVSMRRAMVAKFVNTSSSKAGANCRK